MKGLNAFITEVLRNPYLRQDTAVNEFLTQSNKSAWEKFKKVGVRPVLEWHAVCHSDQRVLTTVVPGGGALRSLAGHQAR